MKKPPIAWGDSLPGNRLDYHLSWDGNSAVLGVDVEYYGGDSTEFVYGTPELGGQWAIFDVVGNVHATGPDSIVVDRRQRRIVVYHRVRGRHKLHYTIDGTPIFGSEHVNPNELFRPVIVDSSLYILGNNLFLSVNDPRFRKVRIVWDRWPRGMPYFISTDPQALPSSRQEVPIDQMMRGLIVMDHRLQVTAYSVYGIPYYAVTSGRDTINNMLFELEPLYHRFFPALRDFWRDYSGHPYFLSALPFVNRIPSANTGYGLGNGFTMKYSGPYNFEKQWVLAHESSHTWIGHKLSFEEKGYNWFHEGFNDYVAVITLVSTGLVSTREFVSYVNEQNLAVHYANPVASAPADSIDKYFWTDKRYQGVYYQRGFIYAFYLDNQLRLASGGRKTIRDLLLALLRWKWLTKKKILQRQDYIAVASRFLPRRQVETELATYLEHGSLLDFRRIRLMTAFSVNYRDGIPRLAVRTHTDLKKFYHW